MSQKCYLVPAQSARVTYNNEFQKETCVKGKKQCFICNILCLQSIQTPWTAPESTASTDISFVSNHAIWWMAMEIGCLTYLYRTWSVDRGAEEATRCVQIYVCHFPGIFHSFPQIRPTPTTSVNGWPISLVQCSWYFDDTVQNYRVTPLLMQWSHKSF